MASLSSSAKLRLVIAFLLVVGLAAALVIVVSSGGDDGGGKSDQSAAQNGSDQTQIKQVIQDFNSALQAHDTHKVCELSYPISAPPPPGVKIPALKPKQIADCEESFSKATPPDQIPDIQVGKITINTAGQATVQVSDPGGSQNGTLALIKADGEWKIAVPDRSASSPPPS